MLDSTKPLYLWRLDNNCKLYKVKVKWFAYDEQGIQKIRYQYADSTGHEDVHFRRASELNIVCHGGVLTFDDSLEFAYNTFRKYLLKNVKVSQIRLDYSQKTMNNFEISNNEIKVEMNDDYTEFFDMLSD